MPAPYCIVCRKKTALNINISMHVSIPIAILLQLFVGEFFKIRQWLCALHGKQYVHEAQTKRGMDYLLPLSFLT